MCALPQDVVVGRGHRLAGLAWKIFQGFFLASFQSQAQRPERTALCAFFSLVVLEIRIEPGPVRTYFTMILLLAASSVPCTRTRFPSNFLTSS